MMDESITYQAYSPGEENGIIKLLCMVFPKWRELENPFGYWTWKHLEGPAPSEVYVVKDGEQIVGVNHRIVLDIKIGDYVLRSGYGDDVAVHPDYRGQGIWKNLRIIADEKNAEHGINFDYLATENPIVKENIIKMGYTPSKHYISHLLRIRDREAFLKRKQRDDLVTRVGVAALTKLGEVKQSLSPIPAMNEDFSIVDIARFDQGIDGFWEKVKDSYGYCIVKNANYLNWKHSRPSISECRLRVAVRGEDVLGFSALSLSYDGDYREGSISDLLALPNRPDVAHALIGDAGDHFNHEEVAAIFYQATKGHPYEALAKQYGFIDASSQNKTYFYYRIINRSIPTDYLENLNPSRVQLNYF